MAVEQCSRSSRASRAGRARSHLSGRRERKRERCLCCRSVFGRYAPRFAAARPARQPARSLRPNLASRTSPCSPARATPPLSARLHPRAASTSRRRAAPLTTPNQAARRATPRSRPCREGARPAAGWARPGRREIGPCPSSCWTSPAAPRSSRARAPLPGARRLPPSSPGTQAARPRSRASRSCQATRSRR